MMSETVHDLRGIRRKIDEVSSSTRKSDGSLGSNEQPAPQFLPGIPDEITLALVVPKLSWRTFYVLSSVSQGWKRAIQSGQVYDARVRAEGTETLAVIDRITGATHALGLYSGTDKSVHKLPPIPNVRLGIPRLSKSISLDGKIYVMGGQRDRDELPRDRCGFPSELDHRFSLDNVYVLDLARQRPWEQCKSMGYGRVYFGIGVVGGKIYVLGGQSYSTGPAVTVSEVYDPVYNTWHPFDSMLNWRIHQEVLTIGDELIIHGGRFSPHYEMTKLGFVPSYTYDHILRADFLEIYHPRKNGWRKVTPGDSTMENLFIHQGQLHSISWWTIDVCNDIDGKSWTSRYSYSHAGSSSALLAEDMLVVSNSFDPHFDYNQDLGHSVQMNSSALVSGNELVARVVHWIDRGQNGDHVKQDLLCSTGFGKQETIEWQKVECSFQLSWLAKMCSLQL